MSHDLPRERLRQLGAELDSFEGQRGRMGVDRDELRALLSMASRCVGVETVRKLVEARRHNADYREAMNKDQSSVAAAAWREYEAAIGEFAIAARVDLREAALDGEGTT
jgi:hypothetical protein